MRIVAVFDNEGRSFNDITVVIDEEHNGLYTMLSCDSKGGKYFSEWYVGIYEPGVANKHLGEWVSFEQLNEATQQHVARRVFG